MCSRLLRAGLTERIVGCWRVHSSPRKPGTTASGYGFCPHLGYDQSLPIYRTNCGLCEFFGTLYAESTPGSNGTSFVKPSLGLVSWNGSSANNSATQPPATLTIFCLTHVIVAIVAGSRAGGGQ